MPLCTPLTAWPAAPLCVWSRRSWRISAPATAWQHRCRFQKGETWLKRRKEEGTESAEGASRHGAPTVASWRSKSVRSAAHTLRARAPRASLTSPPASGNHAFRPDHRHLRAREVQHLARPAARLLRRPRAGSPLASRRDCVDGMYDWVKEHIAEVRGAARRGGEGRRGRRPRGSAPDPPHPTGRASERGGPLRRPPAAAGGRQRCAGGRAEAPACGRGAEPVRIPFLTRRPPQATWPA